MLASRLQLAIALLAGSAQAQTNFNHVSVDSDGPGEMQVTGVGDLDGDGIEDLIIASKLGAIVWYEERSVPGSWTRHTIAAASESLGGWSTDLETLDIDQDGDVDLITSDWYENNRLVWFENEGAGASWIMHVIGTPRAHDIELGDFDGDGDQDLVTREQLTPGGVLQFWRQDSPTSWSRSTFDLPSVSTGEGIDVADLDDDGDLDVVIPRYWYENTGNFMGGGWVEHAYTSAYTHPHTFVLVSDMDSDGDMDVVLTPNEFAGSTGRTTWFEAPDDPRSGNWTEHVIDPSVEQVTHSLQAADFDLDGDLDVATAEMHQGANPDEVRVYFNLDGSGTSWSETVIDNVGSHNLQVVDADGDGDLDLFGANWTQSDQVDLWQNQSAGGVVYCLGASDCTCSNPGRQGGGCHHVERQGARLTGVGSSSVASDDLELRTTNVPPGRSGLCFMGESTAQHPFGDGRRCVGGRVFRFAISNSGSDGLFRLGPGIAGTSHTRFAPPGHIQSGQTWRFQTWYRDPAGPCGTGFNLSNGFSVTFVP